MTLTCVIATSDGGDWTRSAGGYKPATRTRMLAVMEFFLNAWYLIQCAPMMAQDLISLYQPHC